MAMAALLSSFSILGHSEAAYGLVLHGQATGGNNAVSSATWAAVATQSATPSPSALTLSFGISLIFPPAPQYFQVVNTGTRTLTATAYFVSLSGLSLGSASVALKACAVGVPWSGGSCQSGTATTIGSFNSGSTLYIDSSTAPTTAASVLYVQASVSSSLASALTAVVNTEVSSLSPRDFLAKTTNH
jgi:hypothetical protein